MLEIIIDRCSEAGFQNFYLAVNYLKQKIIDHFGDGSKWGINIHYLEENQPLGTAGALRACLKDFVSLCWCLMVMF